MGTACSRGKRGDLKRETSRTFSEISDEYRTIAQVQESLRQAGLESTNLILGIDFTKSNEWTGHSSYTRRSLHTVGDGNLYERAISIIGQTLAVFDEANLIPCFGFGDASTQDQDVFSFYNSNLPCHGFDDVLARYRQMVLNVTLSGPTSFAPIIEEAVNIVQESAGQYHTLVIIADGLVTRSGDTSPGSLSPQEKATVDAIVTASNYPMSIILVGVGNGPWDKIGKFLGKIPRRVFENFHFAYFSAEQEDATLAYLVTEKIPSQFMEYKAAEMSKLLGRKEGGKLDRRPLPPPKLVLQQLRQEYTPSSASYTRARTMGNLQRNGSRPMGNSLSARSRAISFQGQTQPRG